MPEPNWLEQEYIAMEAEQREAIERMHQVIEQARAHGRYDEVATGERILEMFQQHLEDIVNRFAPEISLN